MYNDGNAWTEYEDENYVIRGHKEEYYGPYYSLHRKEKLFRWTYHPLITFNIDLEKIKAKLEEEANGLHK